MTSFGSGKAVRGRNRMGRARSTFDRAIVLRRMSRTLAAQTGRNFAPRDAVALKLSTERPAVPSVAPPSSNSGPVLDAEGWKGWWTAAEGVTDPPNPKDPPVASTAASPIVWRTTARVGTATWAEPEVFELRCRADVRERAGSEGDQTGTEVGRTVASFRVRPANVELLTDDLGSLPVAWELLEGSQAWDVVETIASWTADRYVDLRAVRRESPRS